MEPPLSVPTTTNNNHHHFHADDTKLKKSALFLKTATPEVIEKPLGEKIQLKCKHHDVHTPVRWTKNAKKIDETIWPINLTVTYETVGNYTCKVCGVSTCIQQTFVVIIDGNIVVKFVFLFNN